MAIEDIPKLERIIQLPKLTDFKDLLKWAKEFVAMTELRLTQISSKSNDQSWQLIHEKVFEAAANAYTISMLDGNTQREYLLLCTFKNVYNGTANFYMQPNGDTGANYGYAYMGDTGAAAYRGNATNATAFNVGYCLALNEFTFHRFNMFAKSGIIRVGISTSADAVAATVVGAVISEAGVWNNTADNITSMVFSSNRANAIGIGSRITLYSR